MEEEDRPSRKQVGQSEVGGGKKRLIWVKVKRTGKEIKLLGSFKNA